MLKSSHADNVALLAEGVDRNIKACHIGVGTRSVALLAEGVDRNQPNMARSRRIEVALLAEGVDRNLMSAHLGADMLQSPSSRRAWIEIVPGRCSSTPG